MTPLLAYSLIVHVLAGITAIGLLHLVFMHVLKKTPSWHYLRMLAGWSTILFFLSWATSAYYYVTYYGRGVRSVILEGDYPWAHQVFMEAKEHIFIMIPFMAFTIWLMVRALATLQDEPLHRAVRLLALVALALGLFVALAGIFVSGAAR